MAKKKATKKARKVRVTFRRNRSKPARDKSWTREFHEHGFHEKDTVSRESVIPKGELSRKRTVIEGLDPDESGLRDGIVTTMRGLYADVDDGTRTWQCTVRRILRTRLIEQRHPVAVGDRVRISISGDEEGLQRSGVIHSIHDRTSRLTRRYAKRVHVIVANVSRVLIVSSVVKPSLKPHLIDRYLVSAHAGGIHPIICINKIDLGQPGATDSIAKMYRQIGYDVLETSATTGEGLERLRGALKDQESVIVGQSGVGKSSLLNAVQPSLALATDVVSETTLKGKHTTTSTQLLKLDFGGYVVDTPGVKSYELADVSKAEYELHFVEFADHVPRCKFPDCTHIHEDNCAVKSAVEAGLIDSRRHVSYARMFQED